MNKQHMRMALRAFKRCKQRLARNLRERKTGKTCLICITLDEGKGGNLARKIVRGSIAPYSVITQWMDAHGYRDYRFADVQRVRHAFVDACITELERRLGHDDFE